MTLRVTRKDGSTFSLEPSDRLYFKVNDGLAYDIRNPLSGLTTSTLTLNSLQDDERLSTLVKGDKIEIIDAPTVTAKVFYISNITRKSDSSTRVCTITANDRLYLILNSDLPELKFHKNINLYDFLNGFFSNLGLGVADFQIDEHLKTHILDYSNVNSKTVGEFLNLICVAGYCYIYVSDNTIVVRTRKISGEPLTSIDGSNHIIRMRTGDSLSSTYDGVKVFYYKYKQTDVLKLLDYNVKSIPAGVSILENIGLSNAFDISYILIDGSPLADMVSITEEKLTSNGLTLALNNAHVSAIEGVTLQIYGHKLDKSDSFYALQLNEDNTISDKSRRTLQVTNPLLQGRGHAIGLADVLLLNLKKSIPYIECDVVNLDLNLGDIITIQSNKLGVSELCYIHNRTFSSNSFKAVYGFSVCDDWGDSSGE